MNTHPKAKCKGILSKEIPDYWDRVRPFIDRALKRGSNYTLSEIRDGLDKTELQLWVAEEGESIKATLVTSLQEDKESKFCLLLALSGGDIPWREWLTMFEDWAKYKGCEEMRIYGRRGWSRVLGYDIAEDGKIALLRRVL